MELRLTRAMASVTTTITTLDAIGIVEIVVECLAKASNLTIAPTALVSTALTRLWAMTVLTASPQDARSLPGRVMAIATTETTRVDAIGTAVTAAEVQTTTTSVLRASAWTAQLTLAQMSVSVAFLDFAVNLLGLATAFVMMAITTPDVAGMAGTVAEIRTKQPNMTTVLTVAAETVPPKLQQTHAQATRLLGLVASRRGRETTIVMATTITLAVTGMAETVVVQETITIFAPPIASVWIAHSNSLVRETHPVRLSNGKVMGIVTTITTTVGAVGMEAIAAVQTRITNTVTLASV